jgi:hypothetical protein
MWYIWIVHITVHYFCMCLLDHKIRSVSPSLHPFLPPSLFPFLSLSLSLPLLSLPLLALALARSLSRARALTRAGTRSNDILRERLHFEAATTSEASKVCVRTHTHTHI